MNRADILKKANEIVTSDREDQYGSPEDNFSLIAKLWSDFLAFPVEPEEVAVMMILLKVARIYTGRGKIDNWIDIAGYAACGGEIQSRAWEVKDEEMHKMR